MRQLKIWALVALFLVGPIPGELIVFDVPAEDRERLLTAEEIERGAR